MQPRGKYDYFQLTDNFITSYLKTAPRWKKPGMDSLRIEHLHGIIGKDTNKSTEQKQFINKLAIVLSRVANGVIPTEIIPYFRDAELHNVYKTEDSGRPIDFQIVYRKIVSAALKESILSTTDQLFDGLQYALT